MKKLYFISVIVLSVISSVFAQTKENITVDPAESAAIEKTATDYVGGFYNGDTARIIAAVHPELAKRIITRDDKGNTMIQNMGASGLVYAALRSKKTTQTLQSPLKQQLLYMMFLMVLLP